MNYRALIIIFSVLLVMILGASYAQSQYSLVLIITGQGFVSKSPNQASYSSGSSVQLTATPASGYVFSGWSGGLSGSANPASVWMNENKAVTATFTQKHYTLTLTTIGQGYISKKPNQANYTYESNLQLSAIPAVGWSFQGWSGDLSGLANPMLVTIDGNKTLTATFTQDQYTLTLSVVGSGSTNLPVGSHNYNSGSRVNMTATPDNDWVFDHWTIDGLISNNSNPIFITMSSAHTLEAVFIRLSVEGIIHAAFVSNTGGWDDQSTVNVRINIDKFTKLTGKPLYGYTSWIAEWPGDFGWMFGSGDHSLLPLLQDGTLEALCLLWQPRLFGNHFNQQTIKDISAGTYDTYIRTIANECKTFGYPLYLRFGAEMNINQGAKGDAGSWASNSTDFIAAWRQIVNIFRAQGATNVKWVWNPNYNENAGALHHWTEYYPGDSYVDWVGIDMYQFSDKVDPAQEISPIYNDYGDRKPIGIFEWGVNSYPWTGVNTPDAKRAEYIDKFFDAVEARSNVKLISYWYVDGFIFDASTPLTLAKYYNRISSPSYLSK